MADSSILPCPSEAQISASFDNGARWDMCRQSSVRENLVLSDIYYTAPDQNPYKVLASASLSQLHVTYDDSIVVYHDVTQYGLGGEFMSSLQPADCPEGTLLDVDGKPGVCVMQQAVNTQFHDAQQTELAQSLLIKAASQVGTYSYMLNWTFYADGRISPAVGAAGALQRSSIDPTSPFGRPLEGAADKSWLSHTHNYYWRLDFDLGDSAQDDYVRERSLVGAADGKHTSKTTALVKESARATEPNEFRSWEVLDGGSATDEINQTGYAFEPLAQGHKHIRALIEPYTKYDFFVSKHNDCEQFASQNSLFNPDCADNVLDFTNQESLQGEDIVVWHRVSFHHVPRNEDHRIMHSHWDGFQLRPFSLHTSTPGHNGTITNTVPELEPIDDLNHPLSAVISIPVTASDEDYDSLSWIASGLPPGVRLEPTGLDSAILTGNAQQQGRYTVVIEVSDGIDNVSTHFDWQITATNKRGALSLIDWLLLLLFVAVWRWHAR